MLSTLTIPSETGYCRKICTCAVFNLDRLHPKCYSDRSDYNLTTPPHEKSECKSIDAHGQYISALILLNSPTNGDYEFGNYYCTHTQYTRHICCGSEVHHKIPPCLFICADGAYKSLQKLYSTAGSKRVTHNTCTNEDYCSNLCDVVIGDMDSYDYSEQFATDVIAHSDQPIDLEKGTPAVYDTVESIPDEVLNHIHQRMLTRDVDPRRHQRPMLLHIKCCITTDFEKCVLLVKRLQGAFGESFPRYISTARSDASDSALPCHTREHTRNSHRDMESQDNTKMSALQKGDYMSDLVRLSQQMTKRQIKQLEDRTISAPIANDDERAAMEGECKRARALLKECAQLNPPTGIAHSEGETKRTITTVVLPSIAVLGGHGGRLDHEIATLNCILKYAKLFHIMLFDESNVTMACWPDGITQWLSSDSLARLSRAEVDSTTPHHEEQKDQQRQTYSTCAVIPFGIVEEMETTGLRWNIVKGRPHKCDLITQTEGYTFAFGHLLSTSNIIDEPLVTIDLRPTSQQNVNTEAENGYDLINPPTIFTYTNHCDSFSR